MMQTTSDSIYQKKCNAINLNPDSNVLVLPPVADTFSLSLYKTLELPGRTYCCAFCVKAQLPSSMYIRFTKTVV